MKGMISKLEFFMAKSLLLSQRRSRFSQKIRMLDVELVACPIQVKIWQKL